MVLWLQNVLQCCWCQQELRGAAAHELNSARHRLLGEARAALKAGDGCTTNSTEVPLAKQREFEELCSKLTFSFRC